ncbi:MAG: Mrp/NBP35 family ATP-binding protein [Acidimicrobiia bacterium]|nr:Mrp/NBP35 family ATP-binding protein [Acidimicrobiia bacterium]MDH4308422.1 Mrp/NBP35 family ATP-binding protein [Acidimicrobiia bacterium]MDH5294716.1 Mrp/NBP35 family ATP-binding protein [Acidimicrobiia bacterium]
MTTVEQVYEALKRVVDPELGGNIVELGMVTSVEVEASHVTVGIALTIAECPMRGQIEGDTVRKVRGLPGVDNVTVHTTAMTKAQRADLMSVARRKARDTAAPTRIHPTTRVIAVSSGKGGVGKSSVSVNLALALSHMGFSVGLLDADIWGFSVPRMLGSSDRLEADDDTKLIVPARPHGIEMVSTGLIIESEETALMWRGLMLSKALEQFLTQVAWGDLGYLVIDMPPGTGDVQMALARLLPQAEMVVVTTPQKAAQKVAVRVADMARRSFMPIVGVIENMAGFTCDHGETYELFGAGGGLELSERLNVPLIGRVPLDAAVVMGGDTGTPIVASDPNNPAAIEFSSIAAQIVGLVPPAEDETCTGRIAKLVEALEAMEQPA